MQNTEAARKVDRAAKVALASTVVVVAIKLAAAALSDSVSVLAEGLQSLIDVLMSLAVVWTLRIAAAPPDEEHPFGHGKAELIASAFQMLVVLFTAAVVVWQSVHRFAEPHDIVPVYGIAALAYALVANFLVATYLRRTLKTAKSPLLQGEIEHIRSDSLASAGILIGLVVYQFTLWPPLDPLLAIAFTAIGAFFALRQLRRIIHPLMDGSLPSHDIASLERVLKDHEDVRGYHNLHTRETGQVRYVSLHVLLDDDLTFVQAHDLAEQIEDELSDALGGAHVTLHYEPAEAEREHRRLEHGEPRPN